MSIFREQWLISIEKADSELFEKIKNNPKPDVRDLWSLSQERFIEWRRKNDFPILLNHFDKTLLLFKEWKEDNNITNEIILENGVITPFLENKKFSKKDKKLYLTKKIGDDKEKTIVLWKQIVGKRKEFGITYNYELIQTFISYSDWLKDRGKYQEILNINSRHAFNTENERVFIHADVYAPKTDFELLKMGGIPIPVDSTGILFRGKHIEFANLCGLTFKGEIYTGEFGSLSCSYCACDNWKGTEFNLALVELEHCSITEFMLVDTKLQQWKFYDCNVSGDFYNTKLYDIQIFGGNFNPRIQNCNLSSTHISIDTNIKDNNLNAYKTFKKAYQEQGDDDLAKYYYIRENEFIRKKLTGWKFLTKTLSYYYWEYGRKPHRIIYLSLMIIVLLGFVYWFNADLIALNSAKITTFGFWDSFYFSTITFTTLGYGDLSPLGWLRIISSIEAFLGVVNMGFLIAGYSNNKY